MIQRQLSAAILVSLTIVSTSAAKAPATRTFELAYAAVVKDLPEDAEVRVWLPIPPENEHQSVRVLTKNLPGKTTVAADATYENKMFHFASQGSGDVDVQINYEITRHEVQRLEQPSDRKLSPKEKELYLAPNALVPLGGKPLELVAGLSLSDDPLELGKQLYLHVGEHMKYDKSRPGYGNGDAVWACDSRFGNCTDFHSLFISIARSCDLPARFEIGFPLPPERGEGKIGGYHCWAEFFVAGKGWVPVDISEADKHPELRKYYFGNLTENRVTFTRGRDIDLVPQQKGPPLNYFVYPYVEVDGRPWPKEKIELSFSYKDKK